MEMPVVSQRNGESVCALPHATMAKNAKIKVVLRMMMLSCFVPRRYTFFSRESRICGCALFFYFCGLISNTPKISPQ